MKYFFTFRTECTENCKSRRRELENDSKQLRRDLKIREEKIQQMERQAQVIDDVDIDV